MTANQNIIIAGGDIKFSRMLEIELGNTGYKCKNFYIPDNLNKSSEDIKYICAEILNYFFEKNCAFIILSIGEIGRGYIEFIKFAYKFKNFSGINIIFVSFSGVVNDFKNKTANEIKGYGKNNIIYIKRPVLTEKFLREVSEFHNKINKIKTAHPKIIRAGDLEIDENAKTAVYNGDKIDLTKKEYDLLLFLLKNKGKSNQRKIIFEQVWGYDYYGSTNVVDVFVKYLRDKIDQKYNIKLIHTVRGVGYMVK